MSSSTWQQPIPEIYTRLSGPELRVRIDLARQALGERLVILGHHYQQDAIVEFADFVGDSFELSRRAADQKNIDYVIFGGVHFMAESADILTDERVRVILPDLGAGCSMADMANLEQTEQAWAELTAACPDDVIVPVTYMNSSAAIKAFVGEHGGAVCTSSNCHNVLEWAFAGGAGTTDVGFRSPGSGEESTAAAPQPANRGRVKILFFPDQHLGRNTAYAMGVPLDEMCVWDPKLDGGGNSEQTLRDSRVILWKGHCSVHALFRPEHVDRVREQFPDVKVMVHPECRWEVVQKADLAGSTAYIVDQVRKSPPGTRWAIGTETHLVNRLRQQHPEQHVSVLSDCQCLCTTMFRIDLPHLCWAIESLAEGTVVNEVKVDARTRHWATVALQRMLAIKATGSPVTTDRAKGKTGETAGVAAGPSNWPPRDVAALIRRGILD